MRKYELSNILAGVILLVVVATYSSYHTSPAPRPSATPKKPAVASNKSTPTSSTPGPDGVTVRVFEKRLHAARGEAMEGLLFQSFASQAEEDKFRSYTTRDWRANFASFSAALVDKAAAQGLEYRSLANVLEQVLQDADKLAYLPVGAYQAVLNEEPVWIIVVKWESESFGATDGFISLSHVRIFAYSRTTLKRVGFATCG